MLNQRAHDILRQPRETLTFSGAVTKHHRELVEPRKDLLHR